MFLLSLWLNHWLNDIRNEFRLRSNSASKMYVHTNTLSFSLSWPVALVCVVLCLPKSSVDIFKHGAVWMLSSPPPSTIWCVSFFVCVLIPLLRPSCAVVRRGFEWRSCVIFGSSSGWWLLRREETEGGIAWSPETRGCLRDFCLKELLCNDQRLIMDVCALMHECTHTRTDAEKGWHAHSFI